MPHDKSALGKANLDGRFGGLIVWHPKESEVEYRFRVLVGYECEDGKPKKPVAVEVKFQDKDPHRCVTQADFKAPAFKESIEACINHEQVMAQIFPIVVDHKIQPNSGASFGIHVHVSTHR
jgi:hypothetical protein